MLPRAADTDPAARETSMKNKTIIGLAVVLYLLVGLTGFFRFPAVVSTSRTMYPDDYSEDGIRTEVTVCRGLPFIYRSCRTTVEMMSGESSST